MAPPTAAPVDKPSEIQVDLNSESTPAEEQMLLLFVVVGHPLHVPYPHGQASPFPYQVPSCL